MKTLKTLALSCAAIALAVLDVGKEMMTPKHAYAGGLQDDATNFADAHQARKSQFGLDDNRQQARIDELTAGGQKSYSERHAHAGIHGESEGPAHYALTDQSVPGAMKMAAAVAQGATTGEQRHW